MRKDTKSPRKLILSSAVLVAVIWVPGVFSQSPQSTQSAPGPAKPVPPATKTYLADRVSMQEELYYRGLWGVDSLRVKYTESGEIVRFTYRIVDPTKAAQLNDKKIEPVLYDAQAGVKLVIPELEKVGKLRQSSTPKEGMSYWMAFSNVGRRVRPGHRVDLEIGHFHARNLLVE